MSNLRPLFISDAMIGRNGVGTYYGDLSDHLAEHVDELKLICPGEGFERYHGWSIPLPSDATQRIYLPVWRRVARDIRRFDPTVIVIATPGPFGVWGMHLARRLRVPICMGYHTRLDKLAELYWWKPAYYATRGGLRFLDRRMFRAARTVVANSPEMIEHARDEGATSVRLIGTPLAHGFLDSPRPAPRELKKVVFVGRLAAEKNIPALLEAAEKLPEIEFHIAGDGAMRAKVVRAADKLSNLHYAGWIRRNEIRGLLDDSDMLILPSRLEAFGTVALEGMARRRLVLVSSHCGICEWSGLAPDIFQFAEDEPLHAAITRIQKMSPDKLQAKADGAYAAARRFEDETLTQWLEVLSGRQRMSRAG